MTLYRNMEKGCPHFFAIRFTYSHQDMSSSWKRNIWRCCHPFLYKSFMAPIKLWSAMQCFSVILDFSSDSVAFSKHKLPVVMETHAVSFKSLKALWSCFFHPQCKKIGKENKRNSMFLSIENKSLQFYRCTQEQSFQTWFEFYHRPHIDTTCKLQSLSALLKSSIIWTLFQHSVILTFSAMIACRSWKDLCWLMLVWCLSSQSNGDTSTIY